MKMNSTITIRRIVYLFCLVIMTTTLLNTAAYAEVAVIVNPTSGVTVLTAKEIKSIFLGKKSSFPNGTKAVPVNQKSSSDSWAIFIDKVLGKNERKLTAYWARLVFSGKGTPPKSLENDEDVKSFVAKTPGGIGYINSDKVDSSVTVVLSSLN